MLRRGLPALAVFAVIGGALVLADEDVYVRNKDKPIRGKITKEGPKEITVGLKDTIRAEDIVDIVYEPQPLTAKLAYNAAVKLEKESLDPANEPKRKEKLAEALKDYEKVLPTVTDAPSKRHIEYKLAMLRVRQVHEDGDAPEKAIAKLKDFAKKHLDS